MGIMLGTVLNTINKTKISWIVSSLKGEVNKRDSKVI